VEPSRGERILGGKLEGQAQAEPARNAAVAAAPTGFDLK
jgi:hypothetical protein